MFAFSINRTVLIVASPADLVSSVFLFQKWCFLIFSASSTIQPFILYVVREPLLFRDCKKRKMVCNTVSGPKGLESRRMSRQACTPRDQWVPRCLLRGWGGTAPGCAHPLPRQGPELSSGKILESSGGSRNSVSCNIFLQR